MKKRYCLLALLSAASLSLLTGCDFPWDENDEQLEHAYQKIESQGDVIIADGESTVIYKDESTVVTNAPAPVASPPAE